MRGELLQHTMRGVGAMQFSHDQSHHKSFELLVIIGNSPKAEQNPDLSDVGLPSQIGHRPSSLRSSVSNMTWPASGRG
jgi:hypothetical protein